MRTPPFPPWPSHGGCGAPSLLAACLPFPWPKGWARIGENYVFAGGFDPSPMRKRGMEPLASLALRALMGCDENGSFPPTNSKCFPGIWQMNVLIVGNGGREHALAWKISQSPRADRVFVAPGNAGTDIEGENVAIQPDDFPALIRFARENDVGLTVVGPEAPLAAGIVDAFQAEGCGSSVPTGRRRNSRPARFFARTCCARPTFPPPTTRSSAIRRRRFTI